MSQLPPVPQRPVLSYEPAPAARVSFGIHKWGWLCYAAGAVLFVAMWFTHAPLGAAQQWVPYLVGSALGMLIVGMVPALVAFYVGKRSRNAATITFVVCIGLGVIAQLQESIQFYRRRTANAAWSQVSAQVSKTKAEMARQIESGEGADPDTASAALNSMADTAGKAASNLRGDDAAIMRAMSGFIGRMKKTMDPYSAAYADLMSKNPLEPVWIKTRQDIAASRQSITRFQQANTVVRRGLSDLDKMITEELARQKLPAAIQAKVVGGLRTKFAKAKPYFTTVRDSDDQLAAEMLKLCDLLEESWGKWRFDPQQEITLFDDDALLERFNAIVGRVQAIAKQQVDAQKSYMTAMQ